MDAFHSVHVVNRSIRAAPELAGTSPSRKNRTRNSPPAWGAVGSCTARTRRRTRTHPSASSPAPRSHCAGRSAPSRARRRSRRHSVSSRMVEASQLQPYRKNRWPPQGGYKPNLLHHPRERDHDSCRCPKYQATATSSQSVTRSTTFTAKTQATRSNWLKDGPHWAATGGHRGRCRRRHTPW